MDDETIISRIRALVDEEDGLRTPGDAVTGDEAQRLADIEAQLDQCYDLLRQRRALREQGRDPDEADPRPVEQIESYAGEEGAPSGTQ